MRTALMTAVTLSLAAPAAAQDSTGHKHRGFWLGVGYGSGANLTAGPTGKTGGGLGGYVRYGGTPSQQLLLGIEFAQLTRDGQSGLVFRANATFLAQYYPSKRGGGFLKGGVGLGSISYGSTANNTITTEYVDGLGLTLGGGWDVRLGRNTYLVPDVSFLFQFLPPRNDPVLGQIPGRNTTLLFTLGLTWH